MVSAGVLMNMVFALVGFTIVARVQGVFVPLIAETIPDRPAAEAGLQAGDVVLEIDGKPIRDFRDAQRIIESRPGVPLRIAVDRADERLETTITPVDTTVYNELARDSMEIGYIGVYFAGAGAHRSLDLGEAAAAGWHRTWWWVGAIGDFLGGLLTGRTSARELGGPIVIGQLSGQVARAGLLPLLEFMAIISVNLAVLNLLPIPVLDGGHLLFLAVEAVRGKAVSARQRLRLTQIGLLLVVGLMVWAIANDILRLVGA